MPALGLTDHGVMNGAVEHYKACRKHGIKPIIGLEAYLVDDRNATPQATRYERNHLTLLAASDAGFRNLVKLTSAGFLEGFSRGKANVDMELLSAPLRGRDRAHRLPAVALLPPAGRGAPGRRPRPHRRPDPGLRPRAGLLRGPEERRSPSRTRPTRGSSASPASSAGRWSAPPTSTTCAARTSTTTRRCSACRPSRRSSSRSCASTPTSSTSRAPSEMAESFAEWPEAVPSTLEIAERCDVEIELGKLLLPRFPTPDGEEPERDAAAARRRGPARAATATRSRPRRSSGSSSSSA